MFGKMKGSFIAQAAKEYTTLPTPSGLPDPSLVYNIDDFKIDGKDVGRHYAVPVDEQTLHFPSMTNTLGAMAEEEGNHDWLAEWVARVGEEVAADVSFKAARRGTNMHQLCEDYLNGLPVSANHLHAWNLFEAMKPLLHRIDNIVGLEIALYSRLLKIAGRTDVIADFDGLRAIIDYKSSRLLKDDDMVVASGYKDQICGYGFCYTELTGDTLDFGQILIASDQGGPGSTKENPVPKATQFEVIMGDILPPFIDRLVDFRRRNGHIMLDANVLTDAYFYGGLPELAADFRSFEQKNKV